MTAMITEYRLNEITENNDPELIFGSFLDEFYRESDTERKNLFSLAPRKIESKRNYLCMIAAAVEHLCSVYNIPNPDWVDDSWFIVPDKVYALDTKNPEYQKFLEETSYSEYKKHNVYYGDNVLQRR